MLTNKIKMMFYFINQRHLLQNASLAKSKQSEIFSKAESEVCGLQNGAFRTDPDFFGFM